MKSYITRQFKKFMKIANAKGFDKDRRQSSSSQSKSQNKGKKDSRDGGALRFENNFLVEKTIKLEAELFQVRAQLERTSSAKLDEMLSLQKSAFDRTDLGYDFSSYNIASASTTIFVPPVSNIETRNNEFKMN
ncbi:hypothetical protein SO802_017618 [Lithocarpus litseifolius]|uniref:Uncharacterized protein n=1 Tax=Lithocarpus litseifolius TaxID=425828 RepID=A0AAW2CIJ3_9ROSI